MKQNIYRSVRFLSATADGGGIGGAGGGNGSSDTASTDNGLPGTNEQTPDTTQPPAAEQETANTPADSPTLSAEEISKQVDDKVAEALKKATMTETERIDYEQKQREENLNQKEQELLQRELKANTTKLLAESGLSTDIADIVIGKDMKETVQNIKKFKAVLDGEVQKQVTERLKGKNPAAGNVSGNAVDTVKAQFEKSLSGL